MKKKPVVTRPQFRRKSKSIEKFFNDLCLHTCQTYPFVGYDFERKCFPRDKKLINATTPAERKDLVKKIKIIGLGKEDLRFLVTGKRGHYLSILKELNKRLDQR